MNDLEKQLTDIYDRALERHIRLAADFLLDLLADQHGKTAPSRVTSHEVLQAVFPRATARDRR